MFTDTFDRLSVLDEYAYLLNEDAVLQKELYAFTGLFLYQISLIEAQLQQAIIFESCVRAARNKEIKTKAQWEARFDNEETRIHKLSLGGLIKEFRRFSDMFVDELQTAKVWRNYVAHHMFRDKAFYAMSEEGCLVLIENLYRRVNEIIKLDKTLTQWTNERADRQTHGRFRKSVEAVEAEMEIEAESLRERLRSIRG